MIEKSGQNGLFRRRFSILGQPPRRKGAAIAGYWKALQQRHSQKKTSCKWGIIERERYF
ncbi:MAG: hypothetical protein V3V31_04545 [Methylococcales bacterium]